MQMEAVKTHLAVKSLLECSICRQVYQDPRNLCCGHSFCLKCIQNQFMTDNKVCPLCKEKWVLPAGGFQGLSKNFVLNNFIASLPSIPKCSFARDNDHASAAFFCMDCWNSLCEKCAQVHIKDMQHVTKQIIKLNLSDFEPQEDVSCVEHKNRKLTLYCTKCQNFMCHTCYVLSHSKHDFVSFEEADKNMILKIKESIKEIQENVEKKEEEIKLVSLFRENLAADLEKLLEKINTFINSVKQKLGDKNSDVVKKVDDCLERAIKLINKKVEDEKTRLDQAIANLKVKIQNLRTILSWFQRHLPPLSTAVKRLKILKANRSYLEDLKYSINCPNYRLTDASKWKAQVKNWLHLYTKSISNASIPLLNETDVIVIAKNRFVLNTVQINKNINLCCETFKLKKTPRI